MIYSLTDPLQEENVFFHLNPRESFPGARDYRLSWYSLLDDRQRRAIASFLWRALDAPSTRYYEPPNVIEQALNNFWLQYLENPPGAI